ncbi:hypothetical protein LAV73_08565 [Lysinibacillus xylanilyticus]|uniref:hypothetical protein n=1 Tax=Lysinibacillus xylanilyticus TaxID=582475 RepID=UPI002B245720|nr:hypothetical protein [Lysinibacillus xylanilyticus]MEB2280053.1 hypothetical protein [Lysinibacillus xylanilyticus]
MLFYSNEFELEGSAYALTEVNEEGAYEMFAIHKRNEPITGVVTKMDANTKLIYIEDKIERYT